MIPESVVQCGPAAVELYAECIELGESPRMAEMLACRQPPARHGTDTQFFSGTGTVDKTIGDRMQYAEQSFKEQGFRPGADDVYLPELARFPFDKRAFIKHADGKSRVKQLVEETGTGSERLGVKPSGEFHPEAVAKKRSKKR
jgi:hypothetical protein